MALQKFSFQLLKVDTQCAARCSQLHTPHGTVDLPAFMPVGTCGSVKGVEFAQLRATGAQMVLANTYHLTLRPGEAVVASLGGLHRFMGWDGPILTDSGGFQLYSLAQTADVTEEGVLFRSHIDGRQVAISPERAIEIQQALGADIIMALDHVVGLPNELGVIRDATERTVRWAKRCQKSANNAIQALFAIVQGGLDPELRVWCARELCKMDYAGYAVGGLSVGELPEDMYRTLEATVPELPAEKPRYLMGVGRPIDILESIRRGIDLFDCVIPTRNGRNAMAFTDQGPLRLRNLQYERDKAPLETGCPCAACRHSRGYIRHLFIAGEMLGPILLSIHNLTYYHRLMAQAREAILADCFEEFLREKKAGWKEVKAKGEGGRRKDEG
ncbi:MAG: tRNA guanosine(34) transglycosylase Tgt [Thermoguttaceae bacterium]